MYVCMRMCLKKEMLFLYCSKVNSFKNQSLCRVGTSGFLSLESSLESIVYRKPLECTQENN